MDRTFCLNTASFPAQGRTQAYELLLCSIREALKTRVGKDGRFKIIYDNSKDSSFLSICISVNYSIKDFLDDLVKNNYRELCELIVEMFDKGPAISSLSDEETEELASACFYFDDVGYTQSIDILGLAWFFGAILLSINTSSRWENSEVSFAKYDESGTVEKFSLPNISMAGHAEALSKAITVDSSEELSAKLNHCVLSESFCRWYDSLDQANRHRLAVKLYLANERGFAGGKPLFDTLTDADGMRELRVPFFPGGAIRVLFGGIRDGKFAILLGFVKKSNNEGYKTYIPQAAEIWAAL